jgi:hypothetical protein
MVYHFCFTCLEFHYSNLILMFLTSGFTWEELIPKKLNQFDKQKQLPLACESWVPFSNCIFIYAYIWYFTLLDPVNEANSESHGKFHFYFCRTNDLLLSIFKIYKTQLERDNLLNLSILLWRGKESNYDSFSNGEWSRNSPTLFNRGFLDPLSCSV